MLTRHSILIKLKTLLPPLLVTGLISFVSFGIFDLHYMENDDMVMQMILNGTLNNGVPDYHSVFHNIVFSYSVFMLYSTLPQIEWYPLLLVALLVISNFACNVIIFKNTNGVKKAALLTLSILSVWFFVQLQFTVVAACAAFAGYLVYVASEEKILRFTGLFLVICGALLRFDMFALVTVCALPFVLGESWTIKKFIPLAVTGILVLGFLGIDYFAYHQDGWNHYTVFNNLRGKLNDNPNFNLENPAVRSLITPREFFLFNKFIYTENITIQKMQELWVGAKGNYKENPGFWFTIRHYYYTSAIFLICALLNLYQRKYFLALFLPMFLAMLYYITVNHYAKERIVYPMLFGYSLLTLYFYNLKSAIFPALVILFIGIQMRFYEHYLTKMEYEHHFDAVKHLSDPGKVYVFTPASSGLLGQYPFSEVPPNIHIGGWLTNAPLLIEDKRIKYKQNTFETESGANQLIFVSHLSEYEQLVRELGDVFVIRKKINNVIFYNTKNDDPF